MISKIIARTIYKEGYTLDFFTGFNTGMEKIDPDLKGQPDIQLQLKKDDRVLLSAICHFGSYGSEHGLWEIMPNHSPKSWGDSVKGHLTFKEVIKYMDREIKLA